MTGASAAADNRPGTTPDSPRAATPPTAVVELSREVERISDPISDATADGLRADTRFRGVMVGVMCLLFLGLNGVVMWVVHEAFKADLVLLQRTPPLAAADRLVTSSVLTALIGATVVQTGIGFISILSYLFPKRGG